jgi:Xaa-Pro aminopeptidase
MIYKARRRALLATMGDKSIAFIPSATDVTRSNDTEYRFRQESNFYYMTGFLEPSALLVLIKESSKKYQEILFLRESDALLEMWSGKRLGVKAAKKELLVHKSFDIEALEKKLPKLLHNIHNIYMDILSEDSTLQKITAIVKTSAKSRTTPFSLKSYRHLSPLIEEMRLCKNEHEIRLIKSAIAITNKAHLAAMSAFKEKSNESEIHAVIDYIFASNGAVSDAYTSIVAGGNSANTLHYIENNRALKSGDLVLIDAGCEYQMYASDITRVYPVSGTFSAAQARLYNMILNAQLITIEAIRPGVTKSEVHDICVEQLTLGLLELGILTGELDDVIKNKKYRKYFPHGTGHWMGIDVHDQNPYHDDKGDEISFREGMVMTIEPGIYINEDDMDAPKEYRGIGIRIEDDILVTKEGYENLSFMIPKTIQEIESAMQVHLGTYLM